MLWGAYWIFALIVNYVATHTRSPDHIKPIPISILHHIFTTTAFPPSSGNLAIVDMICIASFFLVMHPGGEYTGSPSNTTPFVLAIQCPALHWWVQQCLDSFLATKQESMLPPSPPSTPSQIKRMVSIVKSLGLVMVNAGGAPPPLHHNLLHSSPSHPQHICLHTLGHLLPSCL